MSNWFTRNFSRASEFVAEQARDARDQIRHEAMGAWFGRNFEPHPVQRQSHDQPKDVAERDIHGNEHGIDR